MTQPDHTTGSPASLNEHAADGRDQDGSSVLLGLEPKPTPDLEKAGQNLTNPANLDNQPCYAPLLGTSYSQSIENAGGSSEGRSPEGVCYDKLLREHASSLGRKPRKTVLVEGRGCYDSI
jgi:hypothetical protein